MPQPDRSPIPLRLILLLLRSETGAAPLALTPHFTLGSSASLALENVNRQPLAPHEHIKPDKLPMAVDPLLRWNRGDRTMMNGALGVTSLRSSTK